MITISNKVTYFGKKCAKVKIESQIRKIAEGVYDAYAYFRSTEGDTVGYHENADRYDYEGTDGVDAIYGQQMVGLRYIDESGVAVFIAIQFRYKISDFPEGLDIRAKFGKDVMQAFVVDHRLTQAAWQTYPISASRRHSATYR